MGENHSRLCCTMNPTCTINSVLLNEDLAFYIASYLKDDCNKLRLVSKRWNQTFRVVLAQQRWDCLTATIANDEAEGWLYHKLDVSFHRDGCLRIFRSHCKKVCSDAMNELRWNVQNDRYSALDRADSRADYYYRAHKEVPDCITLAFPSKLPWKNTIHCVNDIVHDDKPRLVNEFVGCIGDIHGCRNSMVEETSREGLWNLGYHEIRRVSDMTTARCIPRPQYNSHGDDTTSFLRACKARVAGDPRWIQFCHLVGDDRCRKFLKDHLLPMIGPRPTGNNTPLNNMNTQVVELSFRPPLMQYRIWSSCVYRN